MSAEIIRDLEEAVIRLGILLVGLGIFVFSMAQAVNFRNIADRLLAAVPREVLQGSSSHYANTRPIVMRLRGAGFALWGLAIIALALLWRHVHTPVGGVVFGSLLVLGVLDSLVITVVSNWVQWKRDDEV